MTDETNDDLSLDLLSDLLPAGWWECGDEPDAAIVQSVLYDASEKLWSRNAELKVAWRPLTKTRWTIRGEDEDADGRLAVYRSLSTEELTKIYDFCYEYIC